MTQFNPTDCAIQLQATRRAFGYDYRRQDYARRPEMWNPAPWATNSVVAPASNIREAILRELGPRVPVHDEASPLEAVFEPGHRPSPGRNER